MVRVRGRRASVREAPAVAAAAPPVPEAAQRLIEDVLRPLIAADGGEIELVSMVDKRLVIRLAGACSGCPGRPYTVRGIVEKAARKTLGPDVQVELAAD